MIGKRRGKPKAAATTPTSPASSSVPNPPILRKRKAAALSGPEPLLIAVHTYAAAHTGFRAALEAIAVRLAL